MLYLKNKIANKAVGMYNQPTLKDEKEYDFNSLAKSFSFIIISNIQ